MDRSQLAFSASYLMFDLYLVWKIDGKSGQIITATFTSRSTYYLFYDPPVIEIEEGLGSYRPR
jgi:hypothetical protein